MPGRRCAYTLLSRRHFRHLILFFVYAAAVIFRCRHMPIFIIIITLSSLRRYAIAFRHYAAFIFRLFFFFRHITLPLCRLFMPLLMRDYAADITLLLCCYGARRQDMRVRYGASDYFDFISRRR